MSLLGISAHASQSAALQPVNFLGHARKKASPGDIETSAGSIGQIPAGAGQNLLSNALQSLQQAIGAQSTGAISATGGASSAGSATAASNAVAPAPGATNVQQQLSTFLHSLFQTLRQDGLAGSTASATSTAGTAPTAAAATGAAGTAAGQYTGSLESSLQTLIQQLGSNGASTPATANLTTAFNNLVQGLKGTGVPLSGSGAAAASTTASAASPADLKNFLGNLVQNLHHNGVQTPGLLGASVNAQV
jgi:hypothetical protein